MYYWFKMTSASMRMVVFTLIVNLLFRVDAAPFSAQDILDIFGNPLEDIKPLLPSLTAELNSEVLLTTSTTEKVRNEDEADTKVIDVPPNTASCKSGDQKDLNGVCREPWF